MNNIKIETSHTLEEYKKKYGYDYKHFRVLSYSSLDEARKCNCKRTLWKIGNKYYEVPKFNFKKRIFALCGLVAILGGLFAPIYLFCIQTFNIKYDILNCTVDSSLKAKRGREYITSFKIDYRFEVSINDIEVYLGNTLNKDCWTFSYQNNINNCLKIKAGVINSDITIKVRPKFKHLREYGLAVDVNEVEQSSIKFYPVNRNIKYISDWQRDAFPIEEDERIEFSFAAKENQLLPTNIGMWMNGRYAKEGAEVFFNYSSDKKYCYVQIPYFVARDNLQFRCK